MKKLKNLTKVVAMVLAVGFILSAAVQAQAKTSNLNGVVNVNEASVEQLQILPGIGKAKARAIANYRAEGEFTKVEDLKKVKGIGDAIFSNIKPFVTVEGATTANLSQDLDL